MISAATCARAGVTNVVWYRLGESDPGAAPGVVSAATIDLTGHRNLTSFGSPLYTNDVSTGAAAGIGSSLAVLFGGTSQYFSNFLVSAATDDFCVEAWVKPNTDLASTNWATPPETIQNDGTNNFIMITPPAGNRFFRLRQP